MIAGARVGPYEIKGLLGAGGMGEVYAARDPRLGRDVAIKVLPHGFASDPERLRRFEQEARAAAALNHPHVIAIHDIGTHEGKPYLVTELLEGETLREHLVRTGPLAPAEAFACARQISSGLEAAHDRGIVHRDLKPENLFVTREGRIKILDFGLAKQIARPAAVDAQTETLEAQTEAGQVLGTVGYMAPEQVRGERSDARADVFATGCVLYEMLTGDRAFAGQSTADTLSAILRDEPRALRPEMAESTFPPGVIEVLRRCLAKSPGDRYGSGRELAGALEAAAADPTLGSIAPPTPSTARARPTRRTMAIVASVAAIVVAGLVATVTDWRPGRAPSHDVRSIAVLPLHNLSGVSEEEYLADGLTDALITRLAQVKELRVISRSSVMTYKTNRKSMPEMARELGVDAIVEGSVQRAGDRVRISARLVHGPSDTNLWAREFERDLRDVLALQADVAQAVALGVTVQVRPEETRRLADARPVEPEVYQHVLRGRHFWNKREEEDLKRALKEFEEAIRLDPNCAPAYSGLADVYITLFDYELMRGDESTARARDAAEKALAIDASQASAHASLAHINLHEWRWDAADQQFRQAIALDPSYTVAQHWHALSLTAQGRTDDAVAAMRRAFELDPLSVRISADLGMALLAARQYDQAVEQERRTLELHPKALGPRWIMGMALQQLGQFEPAIREMRTVLAARPDDVNTLGSLGNLYAVSGRTQEAHAVLKKLLPLARESDASFYVALVYAGLGEKPRALDWLERAVAARSGSVRYLKVEPRLDSLRAEPRYVSLMKKVGLSP